MSSDDSDESAADNHPHPSTLSTPRPKRERRQIVNLELQESESDSGEAAESPSHSQGEAYQPNSDSSASEAPSEDEGDNSEDERRKRKKAAKKKRKKMRRLRLGGYITPLPMPEEPETTADSSNSPPKKYTKSLVGSIETPDGKVKHNYLFTERVKRHGNKSLDHYDTLEKKGYQINLCQPGERHCYSLGEMFVKLDFGNDTNVPNLLAMKADFKSCSINSIDVDAHQISIIPILFNSTLRSRSSPICNDLIISWKVKQKVDADYVGINAKFRDDIKTLERKHPSPENELEYSYERINEYYFRPEVWSTGVTKNWFIGLGRKTFCLTFAKYDKSSRNLTFKISMNSDLISPHNVIEDIPQSNNYYFRDILSHFLDVELYKTYTEQLQKENIDWFYEQISTYHNAERLKDVAFSLQHKALIPPLRKYQKEAVLWMLFREKVVEREESKAAMNVGEEMCKMMYAPVKLLKRSDGELEIVPAFYNRFIGYLTFDKPTFGDVSGGMLCDEMGLGKTLEIIDLILLNKKQESNSVDDIMEVGPGPPAEDEENGKSENEPPEKKKKMDHKVANNVKCFCGSAASSGKKMVTCVMCSSKQHSACLKFDYTNVKKYICNICFSKSPPSLVKATLIIAPEVIRKQWITEIDKHVKKNELKVLPYEGRTRQMLSPTVFEGYDIVVTSYEVLSRELNFMGMSDWGQRLRDPTGARGERCTRASFPSPLPFTKWWRICIDEAQMIEGLAPRMSQMAMELPSVHKWCVTGTPMHQGVDDLYGLVSFLGLRPINEERWWRYLILDLYYRQNKAFVLNLFGQVMWRRNKSEVADQLGLAPQINVNHWLSFSPVESYFYNRQFDLAANKIIESLDYLCTGRFVSHVTKLANLDRHSLLQLLDKFLEIRQACCHPQAVHMEGAPLTYDKVKIFTMETLLDELLENNMKESNESLFIIMKNLNKLGEAYIKISKINDAFSCFKEVFELEKKHGGKLSPKAAMIIKTIELFPNARPWNRNTEFNDMKRDAEQLTVKYRNKYSEQVREAQRVYIKAVEKTNDLQRCFSDFEWFKEALSGNYFDSSKIFLNIKKFMQRIGYIESVFLTCPGSDAIVASLIQNLTKLEATRKQCMDLMKPFLTAKIDAKLIGCSTCDPNMEEVGDENEESGAAEQCALCKVWDAVEKYQSMVLNVELKTQDEMWNQLSFAEQQRRLLNIERRFNAEEEEAKSADYRVDTEIAIQMILDSADLADIEEIVLRAEESIRHFGFLKDEVECQFKILENILDERFGAVEIKTKKIKRNSQKLNKKGKKIEEKIVDYRNEMGEHKNLLTKNTGLLYYLENMKANGIGAKGDDECQICCGDLGNEYSILTCAHFFCHTCVKRLCENGFSLICPICRTKTNLKDVRPVACEKREDDQEERAESTAAKIRRGSGPDGQPVLTITKVNGQYSTKVDGIVEVLLKIKAESRGEKILIFSSWGNMLDLLEFAMLNNRLTFLRYKTGGTREFSKLLDSFKRAPAIQAFLMPLKMASAGLNITEACHVMFIEPQLNVATELQAIARVHRGGQTKQTYVHRFYVLDTIEEDLYKIFKSRPGSSNPDEGGEDGGLTMQDLRNLVTRVSQA